jgi:leucyl aminopeptidase
MKITLSNDSITRTKAELIAVGVRQGRNRGAAFTALDKALGGALSDQIKDEDWRGRAGDVLKLPIRGRVGSKWVVLVGTGEGAVDWRELAARATGAARLQKTVSIAIDSPGAANVRQAAEGAVLGGYRYEKYLTGPRKPKGGIRQVNFLVDKVNDDLKAAAEKGRVVGEATNLARDLVNGPPNDINPPALAEAAKQACTAHGVKATVWNKARIEKEGMHLFLAVNRGSDFEPRFVHMEYKPAKAKARVVFVGKGLTFDSGGLCIKPAKAMIDMKCDMSGAATTLGVVIAAAQLGLPVEVHGIIGCTENMTGSKAYRPGDIWPSLDGKMVEIINTDAEGRLVLADILTYAARLEPDYMIDHATLTGACMVALGRYRAGLYSNDDGTADAYRKAAEEAGEKFWRMPLDEDLRESLNSDVADLKHTGDSHGGSISAALFLREFIGGVKKWVHNDIAGPAFQERAFGVHPKGGTGFGIATGVRFLESL